MQADNDNVHRSNSRWARSNDPSVRRENNMQSLGITEFDFSGTAKVHANDGDGVPASLAAASRGDTKNVWPRG